MHKAQILRNFHLAIAILTIDDIMPCLIDKFVIIIIYKHK